MPESTLVAAVAEFAKAALSDAAKERLKDWLTDTVRVKRVIRKTAFAFSTRLPGTQGALEVWVETDAFRSAMAELLSGRVLPESLAAIDEFLGATGLGFGSLPRDGVSEMLAAFYGAIREEMVAARQGLVLTDNRLGEVLRQVQEHRADFAAQARPSSTGEHGLQTISKELLIELAGKQGWGGDIRFASEIHINLEPPPLVQTISRRSATVHAILDKLHTTTWYAMHGGSGSGKTQLADLIVQTFVGRKVWIRLGGQQPAAGLVLELALAKLSARQPGQATQDWCESACTAVGSGGIMVLDDLPRTGGHEALGEHLTALCAACTRTDVHLVTTSAGPLAAAIRGVVADQLHEEPVPVFREEDIRDLFLAHGAPEPFLASSWFGFVYRTTKRHPILLVEAARYLQARAWATNERSFDDLLGGLLPAAWISRPSSVFERPFRTSGRANFFTA